MSLISSTRPRSINHTRHSSFHTSWGGRRQGSTSLQEFFWLSPPKEGALEIDPEAMTKQERLSRMLHSPPLPAQVQSSPTLFENFLVVGLSDFNSTRPEILFHYGTSDPNLIPGLAEFCFPSGISAEKLERTASNSSLYEVLYSQSYAKQPQNAYVFLLTTVQKEFLYGVCVVRTESVQKRPSFCRNRPVFKPKKMHIVAPRCYCLITRYPFFNLHFDVLNYILDLEHLVEMAEYLPLLRPALPEGKSSAPTSNESANPEDEANQGDTQTKKKKTRKKSTSRGASKILKKVKPEKFFVKDQEAEEAPFPGIRLHVDPALAKRSAEFHDNPFPGIRLHTEKEPLQKSPNSASATAAASIATTITAPKQPKPKVKKKRVVKKRDPSLRGKEKSEGDEDTNSLVEQSEVDDKTDESQKGTDETKEEEEFSVVTSRASLMSLDDALGEEYKEKQEKSEDSAVENKGRDAEAVSEQEKEKETEIEKGNKEKSEEKEKNIEDKSNPVEEKKTEDETPSEKASNTSGESINKLAESEDSQHDNSTSEAPVEIHEGQAKEEKEELGEKGKEKEEVGTDREEDDSEKGSDKGKEKGKEKEKEKEVESIEVNVDIDEEEKEKEKGVESDKSNESDTDKSEFFISESENESGNESGMLKEEFNFKTSKRLSVTYDNKVMKMLYIYGHQPIPKPNQVVTFFLAKGLSPIQFKRPPSLQHEMTDLLREWGMGLTFHTLSLDNIFLLITACLLERKVVIFSKNIRFLSCTILALYPLLRPFVYQSVLIPLLPKVLVDFLGAPVPYVLGLTFPPPSSACTKEVIIFDLDTDKVTCNEELPQLPHLKDLRKKIKPYQKNVDKLFKKLAKPCYQMSEEQEKVAEKLCLIFQTHFNSLFSNFRKYCLSDRTDSEKPITVFLKESFLADQAKQTKPFFKKFLETQIFFQYCDHRLRKMDDHKKLTSSHSTL